MSAENSKVCGNCRHCIRIREEKYDMTVCRCEINKFYLSYREVMASFCRHWAKEKDKQDGKLEKVE